MNARQICSLTLTALACTVVAHAQTSQTSGAIRGTVHLKRGGDVAGAVVTARNRENGLTRVAVTDAKGAYTLSLLPVGTYQVTVAADGLKEERSGDLRVTLAETTALNFSLDDATASATVEVTGDTPQVDTTSVNTTSTINEKLIEAVPLNGRNFTDLVQLTPAAPPNAQGYRTSIEGARGIGNNIMIDGASYNSKFNGEQRGGTRIPFSFGLDSIQEIQVITNPFDVQYGDASGGVINAITKSGTNDFNGSFFTQLRPNSLVAKIKPVPYDPFGTTNAPAARTRNYSQSEYGFNVGGPIIKDKLHYFVNVDYVHFAQDSVPTISLSSGSSTAGFTTFWGPGGMGRDISAANDGATLYQESMSPWTNEEKHLAAMARLDWTINESQRATFRLNVQNYKADNDIYAGVIKNNIAESNNSAINYQSLSWVVELNSVLTPNLLNQAVLQLSTERRPETPNSTVSTSLDFPGFTAGQYYIDPRDTDETTTQVIDNATWFHGDWTFKAGIDWQFLHYRNNFFPDGHGEYYFKNYDSADYWYLNGAVPAGVSTNPSITYYQTWSNTNGFIQFGEKLLANYMEAQYAGFLDKRLTLTFGLRYTREMWDSNPDPNPRVQGLDQMPDNGSLDPRFGFALDLFGDNRTVVRGGYGLFSVSNPAQNVASTFLQNGQNTLPYKVPYNSSTAALFTNGGVLSATERIDGSNVTGVDPAALSVFQPYGAIQVTLIDPRAHMAQSRNTLLSVEHDFGGGWVAKARGVYKQFNHLQYFMDINLEQQDPATNSWNPGIYYNDGYPYAYNHFATGTSSNRPGRAVVDGRSLDLAGYGAVGLSRFDGVGTYKALILELDKNSKDGFGFVSSLTLSSSRDSNSNERITAQSQASNPIDPSDPTAEARSDNDIPVRGVLIAYAPPVWGIRTSATFVCASGYPWTPRYYADQNGDGYFNDVALGGRNSERQPSSKRLNLKLSRDWRFSRKTRLQTDIEVYNLFNWANQTTAQTTYDSSSGSLNPAFGYIDTTDKNTRSVQFSLRLKF